MLNYIVKKDKQNYVYQLNNGVKTIQYKELLPIMQWQIMNQSKENILGYKVKKAQTIYNGKKYFAWFTTDIPVSNGPFIFNGLPGLIVKLQNEDKSYSITLKGLKNESKTFPLMETGKKVIEVKKEQFYKTVEGSMKEIQNKIMDPDAIKSMNKSIKQYIEAKYLFEVI
jgi:GLPGLI family protein